MCIMKIIIDKSKCIGCFNCKKVSYSVFGVGEDGKAKVRPNITDADILDAKRAEINCPVKAIKIIDEMSTYKNNSKSILESINSILNWVNDDK